MALKLFNINLILFLVSCSLSFDKEIINYGPNLKSFNKINIIKGKTSKSFIVKQLGPPSFTNPYNNKNVFYISQKMNKEIGKVNQFQAAIFLEIYYNENNKIVEYNYKKENLPNDIDLSELEEESIGENRTTFEFFKNILSNLRRRNEN
tara:strand:- start:432 stop:878 length:447 start_codon:yes stop_codon:yes gene_type:complete